MLQHTRGEPIWSCWNNTFDYEGQFEGLWYRMVPPRWNSKHFVSEQCPTKYHVTFDSNAEEQGFVAHKENGSNWMSRPSKNGLYYDT